MSDALSEHSSNSSDHQSKRHRLGAFLHEGLEKGKEKSKEGLLKSKVAIQHSLGLGAKPNCIPWGEARVDGELRTVAIGWHPVPGMGGIAKTGLGNMITKRIGAYPDPTQHWAVLVGDYVHQLWMDEHLDVIYINERVENLDWHTFEVGKTRFTDEALRQAGEMVIHNMRETRPAYNVISNNCQNYAVLMLEAIQIGAHQQFATTFAIYQRATGAGAISDLFEDKHPEEQKIEEGKVVEEGHVAAGKVGEGRPELHRTHTLQNAQQVMDEHTTKIDDHHSLF